MGWWITKWRYWPFLPSFYGKTLIMNGVIGAVKNNPSLIGSVGINPSLIGTKKMNPSLIGTLKVSNG